MMFEEEYSQNPITNALMLALFIIKSQGCAIALIRIDQDELGQVTAPIDNLRENNRRWSWYVCIGNWKGRHQEIIAFVDQRSHGEGREGRFGADVQHSRESGS